MRFSRIVRAIAPALLLIMIAAVLAACGGGAAAPTTAPVATSAPAATEAPGSTEAAPMVTEAATDSAAPAATEAPTATVDASVTQPPTTAPEPTMPPAATEAPTAAAGSADEGPTGQAAIDLFIEASRAQLAQKAFRATIVGQDADGKESTTVLEVRPPDSFRLVTEGTEFIIVPDGTFIKESGGEWQASPMSMSGMMSQILSQQSVESLIKESQPDDIKFAGVDLIDGKPMWIYTYTGQQDVGGTMVDTTSKTWIGALDKLPYRVEASSKTGDTTSTSTITYEYDESITIEAPEVSS